MDNPAVTDIDLDDLERKARAAQDDSPGPWRYDERRDEIIHAISPGKTWPVALSGGSVGYENASLCGSDEVISFVVAAHPGAVLALVARVRAAEKRVSEVESVAHLNQSDAIYAQDRAAFLDKMLQKEREQNRAAQARIAQLEAELYERDQAAMERDR